MGGVTRKLSGSSGLALTTSFTPSSIFTLRLCLSRYSCTAMFAWLLVCWQYVGSL